MFRHLPRFFEISRKDGHIPKGAREKSSNTNLREMSPGVSTSLLTSFYVFSIPLRVAEGPLEMSSTLLIQISSLRRNSNVFTSMVDNSLPLMSRYTISRVLS